MDGAWVGVSPECDKRLPGQVVGYSSGVVDATI